MDKNNILKLLDRLSIRDNQINKNVADGDIITHKIKAIDLLSTDWTLDNTLYTINIKHDLDRLSSELEFYIFDSNGHRIGARVENVDKANTKLIINNASDCRIIIIYTVTEKPINRELLDKIGEDDNGNFTYNGVGYDLSAYTQDDIDFINNSIWK